MTPSQDPRRPPVAAYLALLGFVNLPWIGTLLLALVGFSRPGWVGAITGLAFAVGTIVVARRGKLGAESLAIAGTSFIAALVLPPLFATKLVDAVVIVVDAVPVVTPDQALEERATVIAVEEASVRLDWMGIDLASRKPPKPGQTATGWDEHAAPIVVGSSAAGPFGLWLLCSVRERDPPELNEKLCRQRMQQRPLVARLHRAERGSPSVEPGAVAAAREQHGLEAPPELVILEIAEDMRHWAHELLVIGAVALASLNGLGLVATRWLGGYRPT